MEHEEKPKQGDLPAAVPLVETAERRSDKYEFHLFVHSGTGVTISGPAFDKSHDEEDGCGRGNEKCFCEYSSDGFKMSGFGSENTMTGLTFTCSDVKYSMPGHSPDTCTCTYRVSMYYYGHGRIFEPRCDSAPCYKFVDNSSMPQNGGSGNVQDLERFNDPGGTGPDEATKWGFSIQADALGSVVPPVPPVPKKPDVVLGGWKAVASGAGLSIKQSVTWSSTQTKASSKEVAEAITAGSKFSFSSTESVVVPEVGGGDTTQGVEVSLSSTTSWRNTITDTFSSTNGGTKEVTCTPIACPSGTSYQWQASVEKLDKWGALFSSCFFVCMPNQGQHPKCPYGTCCTSKSGDQCSNCTVQWCSESDPDCPFSNPSFKAGC